MVAGGVTVSQVLSGGCWDVRWLAAAIVLAAAAEGAGRVGLASGAALLQLADHRVRLRPGDVSLLPVIAAISERNFRTGFSDVDGRPR